jgi:hypothetical protein
MFPIALGFYHIWFAQSSTPMYITERMKTMGTHFFLFCDWGPNMCFHWGHAQCSKKIADGPINMAHFLKKKKRL